MSCPLLSDPDNGQVRYSTISATTGVGFGSTATFNCDTGYGLTIEERVLTCGGDGTSLNGTWSSDPPSCAGK